MAAKARNGCKAVKVAVIIADFTNAQQFRDHDNLAIDVFRADGAWLGNSADGESITGEDHEPEHQAERRSRRLITNLEAAHPCRFSHGSLPDARRGRLGYPNPELFEEALCRLPGAYHDANTRNTTQRARPTEDKPRKSRSRRAFPYVPLPLFVCPDLVEILPGSLPCVPQPRHATPQA